MCILDLIKLAAYDYFYNYLKKKNGAKVQLHMTGTDSFNFYFQTEDIYADMKEDEGLLIFSKYPEDHKLYSAKLKTDLGKKEW